MYSTLCLLEVIKRLVNFFPKCVIENYKDLIPDELLLYFQTGYWNWIASVADPDSFFLIRARKLSKEPDLDPYSKEGKPIYVHEADRS